MSRDVVWQADVAQVERINLVCLPENYHQQCYWLHILRWPTIVRVAEARVAIRQQGSATTPDAAAPGDATESFEWAVVAYVLAKIEDNDDIMGQQQAPAHVVLSAYNSTSVGHVKGHITSLAVLPSHRRLGIARR